ncbi:MAG: AmmeMemoRadiSam system radical SAM enzyme [Deltaproteobacteria bacterium CG11_big_fil_rev_8_21_14_0_20_49_13]|nr:MAG: AmmeMemoRadiSam system radical SAM enzyme [Deltaproteobacteria bacterium CG11_big_fil_rev_8_21_14_0_20_49_13]
MFEASLYRKKNNSTVECYLCRHNCKIKDGASGVCKVRENKGGALYSIFYGRPCAASVDPIEKKPLFHFYPGSGSFSIATLGCNFQCGFCQNWDISQYGRGRIHETRSRMEMLKEASPEEIVKGAVKNKCRSISYTYSEPTIFYEYARDVASLAKPKGIENIFVTNGYMSREMLDEAKGWLSAANVDLKAFKEETYKKIIKGSLKGVLDSIAYMKSLGIWIEITTLIVPGMNDDEKELRDIAEFIASVGKEIPWHISRFHPQYKMQDRMATPLSTMGKAYDIGKAAGLKYVYLGNVPGDDKESTFCWKCGEKLIERFGLTLGNDRLKETSTCPKCDSKIDGIFF